MDQKTPETKKPAAKKIRSRKPAPYLVIHNANLFGWILSCFFVCGCMFFLGVMVGRNTAPVQFDVDRLSEKLARLPASVLNSEKMAPPGTTDILSPDPIETPDISLINDAIIDQLKDRHHPPEIYEQYIPPVLTPKYAKTPPPRETPVPEPETNPAAAPNESVAVLKPDIRQASDVPAPEVTPEPEKPAHAPPPPPEPVKQVDSGSEFAIQVASLQDPEKARMLMTRFREKGYPAFCQSSAVDGVTWHRVRIGPYPDRTLAARDQERLKAAGVDSLVIAMHQITP